MNFSEQTISILKNFHTINPSILFNPGSELRTISPQKTIMAIATIPDVIPSTACIYDLSRFLSVLSLYTKPDIDFNDKYFIISEGKTKTKYTFADVSMIIAPPAKDIKISDVDLTVSVSNQNLSSVLKAASVLNLPEIAFVGEGGACFLKAIDSSNPTADSYGIELGETKDKFQLIIKTENIKLLPLDYEVSFSSNVISKFETKDVKYFIAIDSKSTYTKGKK
jgi:hypothetical protein